jgi:DNA invertase Pin-like site-specific DNA recombinase
MIAIYARQSVDKKDSISIDSQIDFCKKEFNDEDYKVYIDKGFSGSNINRPEFEKLMIDVRKGLISKVIVYKLDRISRSILDFANIIQVFKDNKVEFTSATEKFDTSTPMGNAMLNITMVFAQLERETIQKRIKDNYYARGKKGVFLGGNMPFGYNKQATTVDGVKASILVPNSKEIDLLIDLFTQYGNTDISLGKLATQLNEKGIETPRGSTWTNIRLSRILHNPIYVKADADIYLFFENRGCVLTNELPEYIGSNGCYLYGTRKNNQNKYKNIKGFTLTLGLHEGVIDSATWLRCQYKLDKNVQIKNTGSGKYTWLSGLTKCARCGYAMTARVHKQKNKTYHYLHCRGRSNNHICDAPSHYISLVEKYVENEIFNKVKEIKDININDEKKDDYEINQFKLKIVELDKQIENLINQIASSTGATIQYIDKKINELDSAKQNLSNELQELTKNSNVIIDARIFDLVKNISNWDNYSLNEKKSVANLLISKVNVDNEIIIEWKY